MATSIIYNLHIILHFFPSGAGYALQFLDKILLDKMSPGMDILSIVLKSCGKFHVVVFRLGINVAKSSKAFM